MSVSSNSQAVTERSLFRGLGVSEDVAALVNKDLLLNQERLEKEIAVKDEALRNMQMLLSEINAASLRRPRLGGAENVFLERMFRTRDARLHAFPSQFTPVGENTSSIFMKSVIKFRIEWQSDTDAKTQLVLSILTAATGLHVLSLQARHGEQSFIVYNASCRLDVFVAFEEDMRTCPVSSSLPSPVLDDSHVKTVVRSSDKKRVSPLQEKRSLGGLNVDPSEIPLFRDLPWVTDYVFSRTARYLLLPPELGVMATSLLQELRSMYGDNATCQAVLENKACLHANQKSVGSLTAILFGFRFLDIACLVSKGSGSTTSSSSSKMPRLRPTREKTMLVGSSGKLRGIASLCESSQGWPRVIKQLHSSMQLNGAITGPKSQPHQFTDDPSRLLVNTAIHLLESISLGNGTSIVRKAQHNLEATAFFINFMFRLFGVARGYVTSLDALQAFLKAALPLLSLAHPEKHFFGPVRGLVAIMPTALQYEQSKEDIRRQCDQPFREGDQRNLPQEQEASVTVGNSNSHLEPPSLGGSFDLERSLVPEVGNTVSTQELATCEPAFVTTSNANPSSSLTSQLPELQGIQCHTEGHVLGKRKLNDMALVCFDSSAMLSPVEAAASSSAVSNRNDTFIVPSLAALKALSISSEWRERVTGDGYLLVTLNRRTKRYWPCFYDSAVGETVACLLDRSNSYQERHGDAVFFHRLTRSIGCSMTNSQLQRALSGGEIRGLKPVMAERYAELDRECGLQDFVGLSHVLIFGDDSNADGVDKRKLGNVGSYTSARAVIDYSLSMIEMGSTDISMKASFMEFLEIARGNCSQGRAMCFPRIPNAGPTTDLQPLSTSAFSRLYSFGDIDVDSLIDLTGELHWHFVASANACYCPAVPPVGFCTELHVKEGTLLLFVGVPVDDGARLTSCGSSIVLPQHILDEENVAGVLLTAGDRFFLSPGSSYCVVTLDPTIYCGSNFYSSATIQKSYWAIVRHFLGQSGTFVKDNIISLEMLGRIVFLWHDIIVNAPTQYVGDCTTRRLASHHIPNALTLEGLLQLFSLLAILEFGTVLWPGRYLADGNWSRFEIIYQKLRKLGSDVLDTLHNHVRIRDRQTGFDLSIPSLWYSFFAQQCATLLVACEGLDGARFSATDIKANVLRDLQRDGLMLHVVQSLLRGETCSFGNAFLSLSLSQCSSLKWAFAEGFSLRYSIRVHIRTPELIDIDDDGPFAQDSFSNSPPLKRKRNAI
ncbi:hypothetical protein VNI00_005503 [Paramarasmius palmivorus]|uniref:Uncharacterized protein n=1 Tax=Paramarasmius palmivorus TaxID=297713 RepID=A0AAW0DH18_9AGAR